MGINKVKTPSITANSSHENCVLKIDVRKNEAIMEEGGAANVMPAAAVKLLDNPPV